MPMPIVVPGTIILLKRLFHHFHLSSQYRVGGSKCIRAGLSAVSGRVCIKYSGTRLLSAGLVVVTVLENVVSWINLGISKYVE